MDIQYLELLKYFPEMYYWIKSAIEEGSLKNNRLKFIIFKVGKTFGSKTWHARLSYKIDIPGIFYYDFLIDALKMFEGNSIILTLSGKCRHETEFKLYFEGNYEKNSMLDIIKKINLIEKEQKEIY